MSLKKFLNIFSLIAGFCAIAIVVGIAIKTPSTFKKLLDFGNNTNETSKYAAVPYIINFKDLGRGDSSYKTQYVTKDNHSWYCSWGNFGGKVSSSDTSQEQNEYGFLLGWNSNKSPSYGGYSYSKEVLEHIDVTDKNYTYIIMDFDFVTRHVAEFDFSAFENLTTSDTSISFIKSHDSGSSWNVISTVDHTVLTKNEVHKLKYTMNDLIVTKVRYGLVVSSSASSCRIELSKFFTQALSI